MSPRLRQSVKATERRAERYARKISRWEHKIQNNVSPRRQRRLERRIARKRAKLEVQKNVLERQTKNMLGQLQNRISLEDLRQEYTIASLIAQIERKISRNALSDHHHDTVDMIRIMMDKPRKAQRRYGEVWTRPRMIAVLQAILAGTYGNIDDDDVDVEDIDTDDTDDDEIIVWPSWDDEDDENDEDDDDHRDPITYPSYPRNEWETQTSTSTPHTGDSSTITTPPTIPQSTIPQETNTEGRTQETTQETTQKTTQKTTTDTGSDEAIAEEVVPTEDVVVQPEVQEPEETADDIAETADAATADADAATEEDIVAEEEVSVQSQEESPATDDSTQEKDDSTQETEKKPENTEKEVQPQDLLLPWFSIERHDDHITLSYDDTHLNILHEDLPGIHMNASEHFIIEKKGTDRIVMRNLTQKEFIEQKTLYLTRKFHIQKVSTQAPILNLMPDGLKREIENEWKIAKILRETPEYASQSQSIETHNDYETSFETPSPERMALMLENIDRILSLYPLKMIENINLDHLILQHNILQKSLSGLNPDLDLMWYAISDDIMTIDSNLNLQKLLHTLHHEFVHILDTHPDITSCKKTYDAWIWLHGWWDFYQKHDELLQDIQNTSDEKLFQQLPILLHQNEAISVYGKSAVFEEIAEYGSTLMMIQDPLALRNKIHTIIQVPSMKKKLEVMMWCLISENNGELSLTQMTESNWKEYGFDEPYFYYKRSQGKMDVNYRKKRCGISDDTTPLS